MKTTSISKKQQPLKAKLGSIAAYTLIIVCVICFIAIAIPSTKAIFLQSNDHFLLKRTIIESELKIIPKQQILQELQLKGNIFDLDLKEIRQNLERIPSVEKSTVERILPNTIKIHINEYLPVARITNSQNSSAIKLIDAKGRIFPINNYNSAGLPLIKTSRKTILTNGDICTNNKVQSALRFLNYSQGSLFLYKKKQHNFNELLTIGSINLIANDYMLLIIKSTKGLYARPSARVKLLYDRIHLSTDRAWGAMLRNRDSQRPHNWQIIDATLQSASLY